MKDFCRAVSAELLKLKRTLALRLAVCAPLLIVLLQFGLYLARGRTMSHGMNPLTGFVQGILTFWTILLLPFYVALVAALLASIEHQGDNWKHILTLPIPQSTIYGAKWFAGICLVLLSSILLLIAIFAAASVLRFITPAWSALALPLTMVNRGVMLSFCAAGLLFSIHMWISLRWRNFIPGLAVGIFGVVINIIILPSGQMFLSLAHLFPWSLPALAMAPESPHRLLAVTWGLLGGIAVSAIGCSDLSRGAQQ